MTIDYRAEPFCANCGHMRAIHSTRPGNRCSGVHVMGIPNSSEGWDEPCGCTEFVALTDELVAERRAERVPPALRAEEATF